MKKILSALLFLALTPAASMAEAPADPCGGLKFESGRITTGLAMAVEPTLSAASDACVNEIAKQVLVCFVICVV